VWLILEPTKIVPRPDGTGKHLSEWIEEMLDPDADWDSVASNLNAAPTWARAFAEREHSPSASIRRARTSRLSRARSCDPREHGRRALGTRGSTVARREHELAVELMTSAANARVITKRSDARCSQSTA
jgi:hypothetical protein